MGNPLEEIQKMVDDGASYKLLSQNSAKMLAPYLKERDIEIVALDTEYGDVLLLTKGENSQGFFNAERLLCDPCLAIRTRLSEKELLNGARDQGYKSVFRIETTNPTTPGYGLYFMEQLLSKYGIIHSVNTPYITVSPSCFFDGEEGKDLLLFKLMYAAETSKNAPVFAGDRSYSTFYTTSAEQIGYDAAIVYAFLENYYERFVLKNRNREVAVIGDGFGKSSTYILGDKEGIFLVEGNKKTLLVKRDKSGDEAVWGILYKSVEKIKDKSLIQKDVFGEMLSGESEGDPAYRKRPKFEPSDKPFYKVFKKELIPYLEKVSLEASKAAVSKYPDASPINPEAMMRAYHFKKEFISDILLDKSNPLTQSFLKGGDGEVSEEVRSQWLSGINFDYENNTVSVPILECEMEMMDLLSFSSYIKNREREEASNEIDMEVD